MTDSIRTTRVKTLFQTIKAIKARGPEYRSLAKANLLAWKKARGVYPFNKVLVLNKDWGEAGLELTRLTGHRLAILNMANAFKPGGDYVTGAGAQEENMFRRTDCHFSLEREGVHPLGYTKDMTRLIAGLDGTVYLDTDHPRVCIRGPEDLKAPDLGYAWLPDDEIYSFYELRSAAVNCSFAPEQNATAKMRDRISSQFFTTRRAGIKYILLGAFGCGAFGNDPEMVARSYKEAIQLWKSDFNLIAFSIIDYSDSSNFDIFNSILNS